MKHSDHRIKVARLHGVNVWVTDYPNHNQFSFGNAKWGFSSWWINGSGEPTCNGELVGHIRRWLPKSPVAKLSDDQIQDIINFLIAYEALRS